MCDRSFVCLLSTTTTSDACSPWHALFDIIEISVLAKKKTKLSKKKEISVFQIAGNFFTFMLMHGNVYILNFKKSSLIIHSNLKKVLTSSKKRKENYIDIGF